MIAYETGTHGFSTMNAAVVRKGRLDSIYVTLAVNEKWLRFHEGLERAYITLRVKTASLDDFDGFLGLRAENGVSDAAVRSMRALQEGGAFGHGCRFSISGTVGNIELSGKRVEAMAAVGLQNAKFIVSKIDELLCEKAK
jgi:hypothetical protein